MWLGTELVEIMKTQGVDERERAQGLRALSGRRCAEVPLLLDQNVPLGGTVVGWRT